MYQTREQVLQTYKAYWGLVEDFNKEYQKAAQRFPWSKTVQTLALLRAARPLVAMTADDHATITDEDKRRVREFVAADPEIRHYRDRLENYGGTILSSRLGFFGTLIAAGVLQVAIWKRKLGLTPIGHTEQ